MDVENSILKITSSDPQNDKFGTGFVIHRENDVTFILTCAHVIKDVGGPDIVQAGHFPAKVVASGIEESIYDLSVLKIPNKSFNHQSLKLCLYCKSGKHFIARGYQLFDIKKQLFLLRAIRGTLGDIVSLEERKRKGRVKAWDLKIEGDHLLKPGFSGSPVIDNEYGHVIGVVSYQIGKGDKGLAISVEALQHIWPDMPSSLLFRRDIEDNTENLIVSLEQKKQESQVFKNQGNISISNIQNVNVVVDRKSETIVNRIKENKNNKHSKKPNKKTVNDNSLPETDPTSPYPSHISPLEIDPAKIKEIFDIWVQKRIAVIGCLDMETALSFANGIINRLVVELEKRMVVIKDTLSEKPEHLLTKLSESQFGWKDPTAIVVEVYGIIVQSLLDEHMFNGDSADSLMKNLRITNRFIICIVDQRELNILLKNNTLSSPVIPICNLDYHIPFQREDPLSETYSMILEQERQVERVETQRNFSNHINKDLSRGSSKKRESLISKQKGVQQINIDSKITKFIGQETTLQKIMVLYAEYDVKHASRLYNDMVIAGYNVWLDIISILPGQDRIREISLALKKADIIVPLFSSYTINKRDLFHKELRMAYDIQQLSPDGFICLIPALIEECPLPVYLESLEPLPLFPIWQEGINKLIKSIEYQKNITPSAHQ